MYISVTTIPSRIDTILRGTLEDLVQQDYERFKGVYLTVPMENMRGQKSPEVLPAWLTDEEPFKSKVIVLRPEKDLGPVMKWIGPVGTIPADAWAFVCDDDQRYTHNYISVIVSRAQQKAKTLTTEDMRKRIFNSWLNMEIGAVTLFSIDLILGWQGVFVSAEFLSVVKASYDPALPPCCKRIDDDVVSVIARNAGFKVVRVDPGMDLTHALKGLVDSPDALTFAADRTADRHNCHKVVNPQYTDNLEIAAIITGILMGLFILLFFWMAYLYIRLRKSPDSVDFAPVILIKK